MKKSEVPQQKGALGTIKEMCYATDENGNYTTTLSSGWDVKSTALEASLQYIDEQYALQLQLYFQMKMLIAVPMAF